MKCPVCKNECKESDEICATCGFTELHTEFINVEEAMAWERSVLRPCRALWNASLNMYETALKKYQRLREEFLVSQESLTQSLPKLSADSAKKLNVSEKTIIYEDEYVSVKYTGRELDRYGKLSIKCVVENKSTRNLNVKMESATCNGWDVSYYSNEGVVSVTASSKNRDAFEFSKFTELSEIKILGELEEFRYTIKVVDADSYDILSEPDTYFYLYSIVKEPA